MDSKNALEVLLTAKGNARIADQLAPHFDIIERSIKSGITHVEILEALKKEGIQLTLDSFRTTLYRMRKMRLKVDKYSASGDSPVAIEVKPVANKSLPISTTEKSVVTESTETKIVGAPDKLVKDERPWRERRQDHVEW